MGSRLILALIALTSASCSSDARIVNRVTIPAPAPEQVSDSKGILRELARQRAIVLAAKSQDSIDGVAFDLSRLVGTPRTEVEASLGPGGICAEPSQVLPAVPNAVRPCVTPGDSQYSMNHTPDGTFGGGRILLVRYQATERVVDAKWMFTQ